MSIVESFNLGPGQRSVQYQKFTFYLQTECHNTDYCNFCVKFLSKLICYVNISSQRRPMPFFLTLRYIIFKTFFVIKYPFLTGPWRSVTQDENYIYAIEQLHGIEVNLQNILIFCTGYLRMS